MPYNRLQRHAPSWSYQRTAPFVGRASHLDPAAAQIDKLALPAPIFRRTFPFLVAAPLAQGLPAGFSLIVEVRANFNRGCDTLLVRLGVCAPFFVIAGLLLVGVLRAFVNRNRDRPGETRLFVLPGLLGPIAPSINALVLLRVRRAFLNTRLFRVTKPGPLEPFALP